MTRYRAYVVFPRNATEFVLAEKANLRGNEKIRFHEGRALRQIMVSGVVTATSAKQAVFKRMVREGGLDKSVVQQRFEGIAYEVWFKYAEGSNVSMCKMREETKALELAGREAENDALNEKVYRRMEEGGARFRAENGTEPLPLFSRSAPIEPVREPASKPAAPVRVYPSREEVAHEKELRQARADIDAAAQCTLFARDLVDARTGKPRPKRRREHVRKDPGRDRTMVENDPNPTRPQQVRFPF